MMVGIFSATWQTLVMGQHEQQPKVPCRPHSILSRSSLSVKGQNLFQSRQETLYRPMRDAHFSHPAGRDPARSSSCCRVTKQLRRGQCHATQLARLGRMRGTARREEHLVNPLRKSMSRLISARAVPREECLSVFRVS